jgi:hypothetical protein
MASKFLGLFEEEVPPEIADKIAVIDKTSDEASAENLTLGKDEDPRENPSSSVSSDIQASSEAKPEDFLDK